LQLARARLLNSLGMSQEQQIKVAAIEGELPAPVQRATAMRLASENRSELVALGSQIGAAEAAIRVARAPKRPEIALQGDWGTQDNSFLPEDEAWSIGVTASMSLYDGGLTRENIDEAQAELRSLEADRNNQLQIIELEVVEATLNEREALERIRLADEEVQLARHSLDVATGRYEVGEGTLVEVIDARTALRRALAGQAEARYDYHTARADVARAMGLLPTEELPEE
ncbi:MAG: TolC family protein, partial [Armatimonadota bacterium]